MDYQFYQFPNGIRLVHRQTKGLVAHCGITVNAGSRDELPNEQGLAHLIEHCIFKGTAKRSMYQIVSRLENVGADLNAYTTKEETCVYASFLATYYERAVELLSDVLFHSVFPEKELEKEKDVVIDELNSYRDNPSEWILDEFDELIFPNHPLGRNTLGNEAFINSFSRTHLIQFINRQYFTNQIIFSSVGNISFEKLIKILEKQIGEIPSLLGEPVRTAANSYVSRHETFTRPVNQAHVIMGGPAYPYTHKNRVGLALLTNLLGGPSMNSRLNMILRERRGIAYNIEANFNSFSDAGEFSIYIGCDTALHQKAIKLISEELEKIGANPLSPSQLKIAKTQLKGQLALSRESEQSEMFAIGKSMLVYNKIDSLEEIHQQIDEVSPALLLDIAREILSPQKLSSLVYLNA